MLVDQEPSRSRVLQQAIEGVGHAVVARVHTTDSLLAEVNRVQPDVILMDIESPDRDVLDSMQAMNASHPRPVVMFADDKDPVSIRRAVVAGVSAYVVDGVNPDSIRSVVDIAIARFEEFQKVRDELEELKTSLAERKVVEKAKGLLMKRTGMDEEAAYESLRKMAMNRNMRIADLAQSLLSAAELLG